MEGNTPTATNQKHTHMKNEKPMASAIFALESIVNLQGSNLRPEVLKTLVEAIDNIKAANRQEYNQKMAAVNMLLS